MKSMFSLGNYSPEGAAQHSPCHVRDAHEVKAALWGFTAMGWLILWLPLRGCLTLRTEMMEILTTPLGSLDAQLLRGELAAGVADGGFVLQVEEDFQPLVLSFKVELVPLCAPHFCTESHGFAIFFHVEILEGEGREKRGSWNCQDTNPSVLALRQHNPQTPQVGIYPKPPRWKGEKRNVRDYSDSGNSAPHQSLLLSLPFHSFSEGFLFSKHKKLSHPSAPNWLENNTWAEWFKQLIRCFLFFKSWLLFLQPLTAKCFSLFSPLSSHPLCLKLLMLYESWCILYDLLAFLFYSCFFVSPGGKGSTE